MPNQINPFIKKKIKLLQQEHTDRLINDLERISRKCAGFKPTSSLPRLYAKKPKVTFGGISIYANCDERNTPSPLTLEDKHAPFIDLDSILNLVEQTEAGLEKIWGTADSIASFISTTDTLEITTGAEITPTATPPLDPDQREESFSPNPPSSESASLSDDSNSPDVSLDTPSLIEECTSPSLPDENEKAPPNKRLSNLFLMIKEKIEIDGNDYLHSDDLLADIRAACTIINGNQGRYTQFLKAISGSDYAGLTLEQLKNFRCLDLVFAKDNNTQYIKDLFGITPQTLKQYAIMTGEIPKKKPKPKESTTENVLMAHEWFASQEQDQELSNIIIQEAEASRQRIQNARFNAEALRAQESKPWSLNLWAACYGYEEVPSLESSPIANHTEPTANNGLYCTIM